MSPEAEPADVTATTETVETVETGAPSVRGAMNPDRLAELEEERRFLLRSIADLERERAAGDVDEHDYIALRDGYTARAANVLRAIDDGRSALPPKRPRNWKRLIVVTAAVVAFGVIAGILVALNAGQRDPGDTITGGTSPNQVASLLSEGRFLLSASDYVDSMDRFLKVLDIDASNVEAMSYAGWALANYAQATGDTDRLMEGKKLLEKAISVDPTYADSHCFLAIIALQFENDPDEAATRRQECLDNDPPSEMRGLVDEFAVPPPATG